MRRTRKSRTPVQPPTNFSYRKRQLPDLDSDRDQYEFFSGRGRDDDFLARLTEIMERLSPEAAAKLRIVNYSADDDAAGLYDDDTNDE
jgi:hypothetical protein